MRLAVPPPPLLLPPPPPLLLPPLLLAPPVWATPTGRLPDAWPLPNTAARTTVNTTAAAAIIPTCIGGGDRVAFGHLERCMW